MTNRVDAVCEITCGEFLVTPIDWKFAARDTVGRFNSRSRSPLGAIEHLVRIQACPRERGGKSTSSQSHKKGDRSSVKTDQDGLTDVDIATFFQDEEGSKKRHLFCRDCDPEAKVSLCGIRREGPLRKRYPLIAVLVLWPLILWRWRKVCRRCRELVYSHAALHVDRVL
jgi:hypothetical protein